MTTRSMTLGSGGVIPVDRYVPTRRPERLVVLCGPPESGKTTILATIYDEFQSGPYGGYYFAGSKTLVAFEERCHESRVESDLDLPDTPRTSRAQAGELLHLRVAWSATGQTGLMLNDVSGEYFEDLVRRPASAKDMRALSLAVRIGIVVDGDLMSTAAERDVAIYQAETMCRAIVEHAPLRPELRIDVVLTKLDLVSDTAGLDPYVSRELTRLAKVAPPGLRGDVVLTAARSKSPDKVATRTGLVELLGLWVGEKPDHVLNIGGAA